MGKHEKKSKKHKKHKKRRHSSSSSSEDEWVEKPTKSTTPPPPITKTVEAERKTDTNRDEWMSLPTLFSTTSHTDRRKQREEAKQKDKTTNKYDPRASVRELNPYWKQGGDGLPKEFKKPEEDTRYSYKPSRRESGWRKTKQTEQKVEDKPIKYMENDSTIVYTNLEESTNEIEPSDFLTDAEMNDLGAKLIKAEILGNTSRVNELKLKLENARKCRLTHKPNTEDVILTQTDSKGFARPLTTPSSDDSLKRKKKRVETHAAGERQTYFPDDGKYSLQQMFQNEKFNTSDQDAEFVKLTAKVSKMDDMDDIFLDKIRNEKHSEKKETRDRDRAINEHKKLTESLDNCQQCIQSATMPKHLMITLGETIYLALPQHEPLTDGHCLIIPTRHVSCATQLDENEWMEIQDFRKSLTRMFLTQDRDVLFYETVLNAHTYSHMVLHCVPVPKEHGDLAPIYFKKAIDECETEWTTNKKLVNLAGKDVRKAVPKGLPYFFVSFGMTEGYAHVIEDQRYFPKNFAAEIIGGILDLHHSKWRNVRNEKFEQQKQRVLEFSDMWNQFDCTRN